MKKKIAFKTLTTVESSFKQIRLLSILFIVLCTGIVGYVVFSSYRFAEAQRQKIYVLDKGKSLMLALSQDASLNKPVEAREHIRRFHELFFTLAPDNKAIESNIKRASYDFGLKLFSALLISLSNNQLILPASRFPLANGLSPKKSIR